MTNGSTFKRFAEKITLVRCCEAPFQIILLFEKHKTFDLKHFCSPYNSCALTIILPEVPFALHCSWDTYPQEYNFAFMMCLQLYLVFHIA